MLASNYQHPEVEAVEVLSTKHPKSPCLYLKLREQVFCWALHTQKQRAWWDTSLLWKAHIKALQLVTALLAFASAASH